MSNITRVPPPPPVDNTDKNIVNGWFNRVHDAISRLNKDVATIDHNTLVGIQGGSTSERYHLTAAQVTSIASLGTGISVTITTAKLTSGGVNGSMTFTNGLLTARVQAT